MSKESKGLNCTITRTVRGKTTKKRVMLKDGTLSKFMIDEGWSISIEKPKKESRTEKKEKESEK